MEMKTWQKAVKAKMASQMVNRIRKMVLVQKRMRTVEAAMDKIWMKLPKNESSMDESETDSQESESEAEPTGQPVNLVFPVTSFYQIM